MRLPLKPLNIPADWTVKWNHFIDLEPDNKLSRKDVWIYFEEDLAYLFKDDYFIDLGFYGNYLENRAGFFGLKVISGQAGKGILYEQFISRSTDLIKDKIERYARWISSGEIANYQGLTFEKQEDLDNLFYSSVDGIHKKLTKEECIHLGAPKPPNI